MMWNIISDFSMCYTNSMSDIVSYDIRTCYTDIMSNIVFTSCNGLLYTMCLTNGWHWLHLDTSNLIVNDVAEADKNMPAV